MATNEQATITLRLLVEDLASGKIGQFVGNLDKLAQKGGLVGSIAQGVGQSFGQMLNPLGLATRGVGMLTDFLGDAVSAAIEEEAGIKRLNTAIAENDRAWDGNIDRVEDVIEARQRLGFADDEQRDSLARLVSVTGDVNKALDLQRTAMDLARLRSMSLVDAGELLGKVYGGNVGILSRYGIQLRKGVTATEALAEIQKRANGQAEAFAGTLAGKQQSLAIALDNLSESIGGLIAEPAAGFMDFLADVVDSITGPKGATGALAEMRDEVEKTSEALKDGGKPAITWLQLMDDIAKQERYLAISRPGTFDWVRGYGFVGQMLGNTVDQLAQTADAYKKAGKTIDDFHADLITKLTEEGPAILAQALGTTVDDVNRMITARIAAGAPNVQTALTDMWGQVIEGTFVPVGEGVGKALDAIPEATEKAVDKVKVELKSLRGAYTQAVADAKDFDKDWRDAIANPHKGERTADQIKKQMEKAMRRRNRALREGNREAFAVADAEVTRLQNRLNDLEQRDYEIDIRIDIANRNRLNSLYRNLRNTAPGYWESEHRAAGGPVTAGRPYIVGEHQAELFVPNQSGTILPSTRGLGGMSFVYAPQYSTASPAEAQRFVASIGPDLMRWMERQ